MVLGLMGLLDSLISSTLLYPGHLITLFCFLVNKPSDISCPDGLSAPQSDSFAVEIILGVWDIFLIPVKIDQSLLSCS